MYIQFLILEGRLGTGRDEATIWLKRYCNAKRLRIISVRLSKAGTYGQRDLIMLPSSHCEAMYSLIHFEISLSLCLSPSFLSPLSLSISISFSSSLLISLFLSLSLPFSLSIFSCQYEVICMLVATMKFSYKQRLST